MVSAFVQGRKLFAEAVYRILMNEPRAVAFVYKNKNEPETSVSLYEYMFGAARLSNGAEAEVQKKLFFGGLKAMLDTKTQQTPAELTAVMAAYERRREEWEFQKNSLAGEIVVMKKQKEVYEKEYEDLKNACQHGCVIPFVGAGLSVFCGYQGWPDF